MVTNRLRIVIGAVILVLLIGASVVAFTFLQKKPVETPIPIEPQTTELVRQTIGRSVEGRPIEAFRFENASIGGIGTHLVFVGGIHGGYEWNSVLLAYEFIDYIKANPTFVPGGFAVTVIPSANPDGLHAVLGDVVRADGRFSLADALAKNQTQSEDVSASGRFNANDVDLNRNFDCNWQATGTWRNKTVSAGTKAFSEPEAVALRDFLTANQPDAVIFWHSQANAVYASECNAGILPATLEVMNVYAKAAGYPAVKSFDSYKVTGDAEGWLASIGIPAITVELKTHETIEWEKNIAGIRALFEYYSQNGSR